MGAGLPAAIAAKIVCPDRKVLAVVGDGGFMMNSREIETALRCNTSLVVLILNDNAYGFIKWEQQTKGFPDFGLDYGNPDFVKYAESYGAAGMKVGKDDHCRKRAQVIIADTVVLIECPIDLYRQNA
jgi:acetolactate synthase-1/2/3 large subunit